MSVLSAFAITEALSIAVKATVLLAVALGLQQLLKRRSSAATRHVVLTFAVLSLLLLPVATIVAPEWGLMRRECMTLPREGNRKPQSPLQRPRAPAGARPLGRFNVTFVRVPAQSRVTVMSSVQAA